MDAPLTIREHGDRCRLRLAGDAWGDGATLVPLARSEFLYMTSRTRGSRGEQLTAQQKHRGALWSQRNLYRDVIEPARETAGTTFTLYDARHTFVSTLMAAGVLCPRSPPTAVTR